MSVEKTAVATEDSICPARTTDQILICIMGLVFADVFCQVLMCWIRCRRSPLVVTFGKHVGVFALVWVEACMFKLTRVHTLALSLVRKVHP